MTTKIRTLAELQAEKTKLKLQMEVAKREFIHSFGTTKSQAKGFLVKKVALPASALGLATIGMSKLASSSSNNANDEASPKNDNFFLKMMPILLPLIRVMLSSSDIKINLPSFLEKIIAPKEEALVD